MREQRAAFKAGRSATPEIPALTVRRQGEPKLIAAKGVTSTPNTAKKIFVSKDGKIIGHQVSNAGAAPPGKVAIPSLASKNQAGAAGTQQKVQIVKSADGKIQVRGLLPGQQLVQMPDGKLQIFSSQAASSTASPVKPGLGGKVIGGNSVIQSPQSTNQPVKLLPAQQPSLLPKPAAGVITSPSKTYCIQRNPNVPTLNNTPIQPKLQPIQPSPIPATPPQPAQVVPSQATPPQPAQAAPSTGATPGTPKQSKVVGIQSLGANTVTIKDGQLIVQGPDHAAATAIARQLSTGQAKLGNVGGKQVLVIIAPEEQAPPPPPPEPPKEPTPPPREPTPPPPPITVTAQLMQTPQGPRIILQGLQGVQLEQQQLLNIQQQVKQQLLKQQALARQQGKAPPTKVSLQLSGNITYKKPDAQGSETTQDPQQMVPPNQVENQQPSGQVAPQQQVGGMETQKIQSNNPQTSLAVNNLPSSQQSAPSSPNSILSQQLTAQQSTPPHVPKPGLSNPSPQTLANLPQSVIKQ